MSIIYVAVGGGLGAVLRYLLMVFAGKQWGLNFPYGTLLINVSGSLVMGLVIGLLARFTPVHSQDIRLFVAVGILGGYTTFSSFALDTITLFEEGQWMHMAAYVLISVIGSLLAVMVGLFIIRGIPA